jgi:hypothetical protein
MGYADRVGVADTKGEFGGRGTRVANRAEKRVWKLLIPKGRFLGVPPTPVFWKKRLQAVENKGRECGKEGNWGILPSVRCGEAIDARTSCNFRDRDFADRVGRGALRLVA